MDAFQGRDLKELSYRTSNVFLILFGLSLAAALHWLFLSGMGISLTLSAPISALVVFALLNAVSWYAVLCALQVLMSYI